MAERPLCMRKAQGSNPCSSNTQLRGAMDSVSDFESGACGFESRRSCLLLLDGVESEGYGFDSRIGLTADWTTIVWPSG